MAALAGHEVEVYGGTSATPTDEFDGINNLSFGPTRDSLETTDFADTSASRSRLMGLKDGSFSLSGDFEAANTAVLALIAAYESGVDFHVGVAWDGATGQQVPCKVESYEISGSYDGKVEVSASLQFNGAVASFTAP